VDESVDARIWRDLSLTMARSAAYTRPVSTIFVSGFAPKSWNRNERSPARSSRSRRAIDVAEIDEALIGDDQRPGK
jgi:hypothetical protein